MWLQSTGSWKGLRHSCRELHFPGKAWLVSIWYKTWCYQPYLFIWEHMHWNSDMFFISHLSFSHSPHRTCQLGICFGWIPGSSALSIYSNSTTELLGDLVAQLVRAWQAICQVVGLSLSPESLSFFPLFLSRLSHLSFSLTLRSDCQVWSTSKIWACALCFMLAASSSLLNTRA